MSILEDRILETVRAALGPRIGRDGTPLRVGTCVPVELGGDPPARGYRVTIMVDPKLGVPVGRPDAEPTWGSQTVWVMTVSETGDRIVVP